eukprot:6349431-Pyramimonas_sp.AAC.1
MSRSTPIQWIYIQWMYGDWIGEDQGMHLLSSLRRCPKPQVSMLVFTLGAEEYSLDALHYQLTLSSTEPHTCRTGRKQKALRAHFASDWRCGARLAMEDAKVTASDLTEVILVGGSTRIPAVREVGVTNKKPRLSLVLRRSACSTAISTSIGRATNRRGWMLHEKRIISHAELPPGKQLAFFGAK